MAEQKRTEFRTLLSEAARPFLAGYTERFIDELELFLVSGLNMEAYDRLCLQRMGELSSSEASADDREMAIPLRFRSPPLTASLAATVSVGFSSSPYAFGRMTVVVCGNCQTVLCQPTGGRARLTEGCSFRRKGD
ncbi:hypothetical protein BHM03_00030890 [Ensete ventricosum]|nr:hypothetical protein BHM03_00030890 [Ensete ventricosum]